MSLAIESPRRPTAGMIAFAVIALFAALLFVRLGSWQLDRHEQVVRRNDERDARVALPPLPLDSLPSDTAAALEWRRVRLSGRWDQRREVLVRNRVRYGQPGVQVVTPLTLADEREILVLRGWLPAPDGLTPYRGASGPPEDLVPADARYGVLQASRTGAGAPEIRSGEAAGGIPSFAALDVPAIGGSTVAPAYFVQMLPNEGEVTPPGEAIPVPLPEPGYGPHLSYAIQWFSFALITFVGTVVLFRRERTRRSLG